MIEVDKSRLYETEGRMKSAISMFKRHGWKIQDYGVSTKKVGKSHLYYVEVYHPWPFVFEVLNALTAKRRLKVMLDGEVAD
jgi:hypothetical protein